MNWKNFKNWLDQNITENDNLLVKIKPDKQNEYGELSMTTLTNFCDSLEANLDNNANYHLLPNFSDNKDFQELFNYQDCYFGKKNNQEKISKNDYDLLAKLFAEWKSTQNNNDINKKIVNTRNILLIGRTGSGKSTLANVLMGEDKFRESARSTSVTKDIEEGVVEIDLKEDGSEKIRYRVIDTIGLADTKLTPQGVLMKLAEMAGRVKREGLNQILFVNKGRFTKEEVEAYDLLSSIIFDKEVLKYTTVVRVGFPEFEDQEVCDEDRWELREENPKLAHILNSVKVIYLDNPPIKGRNAETSKEIREESRKRLLTHLASCLDNYRPSNIDTLDKRVDEYRTNEQLLKDKMKELDKKRKEEAEKFLKDMAELKEKQAKDLKEMREQQAKDLHNLEVASDEKLRKTKNDLEDKQRKDMNEQDLKNKEQLRQSEERGKQDIKELKNSQEQQNKAHQEDLRRNREEADRLREDLNKKNDNSELITIMQQARIDDQAREDKRDKERRDHEQKMETERQKTEQKRIDADTQRQKDEKTREDNRRQDESKRLELERKKANMDAAWKKWEADNEAYLQEQRNIFWGFNRDDNWERGLSKPSSNLNDY